MRLSPITRFFALFCLFLSLEARAQPQSALAQGAAPQVENSRQARRSWVSDNAEVLTQTEERRISAVSTELEKRTGAELQS